MKKNIVIVVGLVILCCFSACYEDSSTLATQNIGNITFAEDQSKVYIGSLEELHLSPEMQIADETNIKALSYEWALTEIPATSSPSDFEVIGTEPELHYIVNRPASSSPYTLRLTITDSSQHNLQYIRSWIIYVQSNFLSGLLISDTQDGVTSDFTLINNRLFTLNYNKDEQVFRKILTSTNGKPYDGLMKTLAYEIMAYGTSVQINQIWTIQADGTLSRFNCMDYRQNGQFSDQSLIINKPAGLQVLSAFKSFSSFYINTSNGLYEFFPGATNRFSSPHGSTLLNRAHNNIFAYSPNNGYTSNALSSSNYQHLTFYDKEKAAFITCNGAGQFMQTQSFEPSSSFDPNNLSDQSSIAAVVYEDMSQIVFLMKDNTSGVYSIYTFSRYIDEIGHFNDNGEWITVTPGQPAAARNKYTVPPEGTELLNKAVSVFFSNRNQIVYVTTANGIYTINYGSGNTATVTTTTKYTPQPGEKITKAKMYQQGLYHYDCNLIVGTTPTIAQTEWNNRAIIITTSTGEYGGKVYIIPIMQVATGTLDISKAKMYDGFGKILDLTTTGY